jgi:signal transduction histidine kinase
MAHDPKDPPSPEGLLGSVLGIVTHDLRTPLSVMHTTASMLLNPKYNLSPQQVREQHERIRRNVDLMNRMIGDVVDLVSLREGPLSIESQPLAIADVLREAVSSQEKAARDGGVTLTCETGDEPLDAVGDRARLLQLFRNLIGNALRSCKSGDRVTVTGSAQEKAIEVTIADSGAGVAAEDLPHVFEPQYLAGKKHLKTGTVLDLYIGKGIVEAHGGDIRCESAPGAGTTYRLRLPRSR